jgi:general secretion pathway protein C
MLRRMILLTQMILAVALVAHIASAPMTDGALPTQAAAPPAAPAQVAADTGPAPVQLAEEIAARGLFPVATTASGELVAPAARSAQDTPAAPASAEALKKVRLVGTVVTQHEGVLAIIEDLDAKRQDLYMLHDVIPDIGEVMEIRKDAIVVRRGDRHELIESPLSQLMKAAAEASGRSAEPSVGVAPHRPTGPLPLLARLARPAGGTPPSRSASVALARRELDETLADLSSLTSQARFAPAVADGKAQGLRLEQVAPRSLYDRLGLQVGDVLQRINGSPVPDTDELLNLLHQARSAGSFSMELIRGGRRLTWTYELHS